MLLLWFRWLDLVSLVSFFLLILFCFIFGSVERRIYDMVLIALSTSTQNIISLQFFSIPLVNLASLVSFRICSKNVKDVGCPRTFHLLCEAQKW